MALHKLIEANLSFKFIDLITSRTSAVTAANDNTDIEFELLPECRYTFVASRAMIAGEYFKFEIYDHAKGVFQDFYYEGALVKLQLDEESITISNIAGVIRLTKTATATAAGLSVAYSSKKP